MKFTHASARVLKGIKIRAGRGATFGVCVTAPFVASLPVFRSRAPTLLSRGGHDCRVLISSSIPQGVCGLHYSCSCLVLASSYRLTHEWQQANKEHGQKKISVRGNS